MITKAEVRAVALGKLALPLTGVLWDVGAGSGSIAVECARLRPALRVIAVEQNAEDAARITANAQRHGATVEVVCGTAPRHLATLPDPDRVFVGGGGLDVLDAALTRLRPGGRRRRHLRPHGAGRQRRRSDWATWFRSPWLGACPRAGSARACRPRTLSSSAGDQSPKTRPSSELRTADPPE